MKLCEKIKNLSSNNKIILKNTFFAFLIKGAALVVSFLTTPAFIKYFNDNVILGVWYTLLSVLIWFLNFDLGIGNGIRNNLVKAFSVNDRAEVKRIISSGFFSIFWVTILSIIVGLICICLFNLNWLFNISIDAISIKTLRCSALCIFIAIMIRFFLTSVSAIFYALQKSAINDLLTLVVSIIQLIFVLVAKFDSPEKSLLMLSLAYLIISNVPLIIAGIIVFCTSLKDCRPNLRFVDKNTTKKVMSIGGIFFICQITYMLISNTNEFLITKLFSPEYTTYYSFYYKIAGLCSMVITLAMTPIWSVVTKAMAEKDYIWLNKLYRIIKIAGILAIVLQFLIIPFLQFIMDIWLGKGIVKVDYLIAIAFACFGGAFVYSGMLSTIVCGMDRMKLQSIFYVVGVIFKFSFTILMAKVFNSSWEIVVWSNAIILIPYCIAQQIDLNVFFKKKKIEIESQI